MDVEVYLPDKTYFAIMKKAAEEEKRVEDFISDFLRKEFSPKEDYTLKEFVLSWNWPQKNLKENTKKFKNVYSVVKHMKNGKSFKNASKKASN